MDDKKNHTDDAVYRDADGGFNTQSHDASSSSTTSIPRRLTPPSLEPIISGEPMMMMMMQKKKEQQQEASSMQVPMATTTTTTMQDLYNRDNDHNNSTPAMQDDAPPSDDEDASIFHHDNDDSNLRGSIHSMVESVVAVPHHHSNHHSNNLSHQQGGGGGGEGSLRTATNDVGPTMVTSTRADDEYSEAAREEKLNSIVVGEFQINGETKHYAFVPPLLIRSQKDISKLMNHWGLSVPGFILEVNESSKSRDQIITESNAPLLLEEIFLPNDYNQRIKVKKDFHDFKNNKNTNNEAPLAEEEPTTNEESQTGEGDEEDVMPPSERTVSRHHLSASTTTTTAAPVSHVQREAPWIKGMKLKQELSQSHVVQEDWNFINKYVERKVSQALLSVVSAADMQNGWILCHGSPGSNEKLVEKAIEATCSSPTILVVDDFDKYKSLGHMSTFPKMKAIKQRLFEKARKMTEKPAPKMINCHVFDNYDVHYRRESLISPKSARKPSNAEQYPLWKESSVMTGMWEATFPWKKGTHYIFCENYENFDPSHCGPPGYLCINGNDFIDTRQYPYPRQPKHTGYLIREAMLVIKPCILFNNTGAETQMYARLIKEIQRLDVEQQEIDEAKARAKRNKTVQEQGVMNLFSQGEKENQSVTEYYHDLRYNLRQNAWRLRDVANKGQEDFNYSDAKNQNHGKRILSLADVCQMIDLYCENPRLFKKIVVPVDPLNDTPESIVKAMTLSFARSMIEAREVGAGDADKIAVEQAWGFLFQLETTRWNKLFWRNTLYFLYILAGFATTLVSVVSFEVSENTLQWTAMTFALVVSICSGILGLTGADSQLTKIQTTQAKIVDEIFRFRMRVGKYSLSAIERDAYEGSEETSMSKEDKDTDESSRTKSHNLSSAMHASRERFSRSMDTIMQDLASLDLYFNRAAQSQQTTKETKQFRDCIHQQLAIHSAKDKREDSAAISGLLTPEDYFQLRLQPLLERLEIEEDYLRYKTRLLQIGSMVFSSIAVILGAANQVTIIPVVVAAATGLFQLLKVMDYERRFEVCSSAARELRGLNSYWLSLSDLDHQSRSCIVHLVRTCEQIALQYATTSAIQVDKADLGMDSGPAKQRMQNQISSLSRHQPV